jgi:hypothetical protein
MKGRTPAPYTRRRPATRRRRPCSPPARSRSPGYRTRGSARTRPRRTGADSHPPRLAPPSRRGTSSDEHGPSRTAASAPACGVDTLGRSQHPDADPVYALTRPHPSGGGMITNRAKQSSEAAPRTKRARRPERAKGGSHLGSTRPILGRSNQCSKRLPRRWSPPPARCASPHPT